MHGLHALLRPSNGFTLLRSAQISTATFLLSAIVAGSVLVGERAALAQLSESETSELFVELNKPWLRVPEQEKSATRLFTAYLDMTNPPKPIGADFNQTTIAPGMDGFADVAKWAETNKGMGDALLALENCRVLGVPYGTDGVDARFVERGLVAVIGVDGDFTKAEFRYLKALETISAYAAADMYRLCEAGDFDRAFAVGLAHLRILRQAVDQTMFDEKSAALVMLCDALSVHRDVMYTYMEKIGVERLRALSFKGYPFLSPGDTERLRRLQMPEGDLIVGEVMLKGAFDAAGQADLEQFSRTFAAMQSRSEPLTGFGAAKRWAKIAEVHGSLDASALKLNDVYDDFWRRWRMRPFDQLLTVPTVLSQLNPVKYAAVTLVAKDVQQLFALRSRLSAEICGTVVSAGLASYRVQYGKWPSSLINTYGESLPKRWDYDVYDKAQKGFIYESLGSAKRTVECEYGLVEVPGCLLYARNGDNEGNKAARHIAGGMIDDFVMWPPLRALSRGQGQ